MKYKAPVRFQQNSCNRRSFLATLAAGTAILTMDSRVWAAAQRKRDISIALAGDIIYLRPALAAIAPTAEPIFRTLRNADVAFGNFESSGFDLEGFPGWHRDTGAGPVILSSPAAIAELREMGFDLFSTANNHGYDWFAEGVLRTRKALEDAGFTAAGSGASLAEARRYAVHETEGVSVALVAATTSLPPDGRAIDADGEGRQARPGLNSLRLVSPGHDPANENEQDADSHGGPDYVVHEEDRAALLAEVAKGSQSADVTIFSLHAHQSPPEGSIHPPRFQVELAHAAIDAGANIVVVHGPHQLRGIEMHKGGAIFYSLGNFAIMLPDPALNPAPLAFPPGSIFTQRAFFESVVTTLRLQDGKLREIELQPFELRETNELTTHCTPQPVYGEKAGNILARLNSMSAPYQTLIENRHGIGIIALG